MAAADCNLEVRAGARHATLRLRGAPTVALRARWRRAALALLGALALAGGTAGAAGAQPTAAAYRTQRLCETRTPGTASCLGIRLLWRSLTGSQLHANAVRQEDEAAAGATPAVANKSPLGGLTPANLHAAYSLPSETLPAGTQTVAVVDAYNDPTAEADLGVYDKEFGLPACTSANGCFRKINQQGRTTPLPGTEGEWATEISLDVEMVHAVCENCKLLLVEASSSSYAALGTAVDTAVREGASEVSNSYGGAEEAADASYGAAYDHPGVAITASTGDCGYLDRACWEPGAPNFPADSPDVVAVGGTALSEAGGEWSSTAWEDAGSACSGVFSAPSWQSSLGSYAATGCAGRRASADVSADADPYTGVDVYDSTPAGNGDPTGWVILGGTSESSPIVAAEFGLAGGARGVQFPAQTLYSNAGDAQALSDVTSGHNGTCATTICKAASGYDGPTGLGSPVGLEAFTTAGSPTNVSAPAISGYAQEGEPLSVVHGEWSGEPSSYGEQWALCNASGSACTAISGAKGSTYTPPASAVGHTIRVQESATDATGTSAGALSAASATVLTDVPSISGFTPGSGVTGSTVTIAGSAFVGAKKVSFDGRSASFTVRSPSEIEATVPNGASAGTIAVSTAARTVTSTRSFVPTLSITSFSPETGAPGKQVWISGVGFTASSQVSFDGVAASSVTYVSSKSLKATVPAGAGKGFVTVTNTASPLGTATSASRFALT